MLHGAGDLEGLYFVGFDIRQPGGLLRTIAQQAEQVAAQVALQVARRVAGRVAATAPQPLPFIG